MTPFSTMYPSTAIEDTDIFVFSALKVMLYFLAASRNFSELASCSTCEWPQTCTLSTYIYIFQLFLFNYFI